MVPRHVSTVAAMSEAACSILLVHVHVHCIYTTVQKTMFQTYEYVLMHAIVLSMQ